MFYGIAPVVYLIPFPGDKRVSKDPEVQKENQQRQTVESQDDATIGKSIQNSKIITLVSLISKRQSPRQLELNLLGCTVSPLSPL